MEILQFIQSIFISNHACCPSTGHHQGDHRSSPCGLGPSAPSHLLLGLSLPSPQPHPTDAPTIRSSPLEAHPLGPSLGSPAHNKPLLLHRRCLVPPSPTLHSPTHLARHSRWVMDFPILSLSPWAEPLAGPGQTPVGGTAPAHPGRVSCIAMTSMVSTGRG